MQHPITSHLHTPPATSSPPATGSRYPEQQISSPSHPVFTILGLHTPTPPTALLPNRSFARGLGDRQPYTVGTQGRSCKGPHAHNSCKLRGRMPPIPATSGAVCPPVLIPTGLSYHMALPSRTRGRLASPRPPVVVPGASVPFPCLPYSLSLGVFPPPIQSHRASFPRPSSAEGQSPPTHSVIRGIRALPVLTGASWAPPSFSRGGGVHSISHRCASPSISGRGFVGPFLPTRCRDLFLQRSNCRRISLSGKPRHRVEVEIRRRGIEHFACRINICSLIQ